METHHSRKKEGLSVIIRGREEKKREGEKSSSHDSREEVVKQKKGVRIGLLSGSEGEKRKGLVK